MKQILIPSLALLALAGWTRAPAPAQAAAGPVAAEQTQAGPVEAAPVAPERLLAAVQASEAAAAAARPAKPPRAVTGPLARLDPNRIDPQLAERFLSR